MWIPIQKFFEKTFITCQLSETRDIRQPKNLTILPESLPSRVDSHLWSRADCHRKQAEFNCKRLSEAHKKAASESCHQTPGINDRNSPQLTWIDISRARGFDLESTHPGANGHPGSSVLEKKNERTCIGFRRWGGLNLSSVGHPLELCANVWNSPLVRWDLLGQTSSVQAVFRVLQHVDLGRNYYIAPDWPGKARCWARIVTQFKCEKFTYYCESLALTRMVPGSFSPLVHFIGLVLPIE